MRIISGEFKGKKINFPRDRTTRPLRDLVKESLFNLIEHSNKISVNLNNSIILDLFSGSGSFGLEALSRGAKKSIFVENYHNALISLDKNIKNLNCYERCLLTRLDCFKFIKNLHKNELKLDIIFLDPPYREEKINFLLEEILKKNILNKNGIIVIHRHKKDNIKLSEKLNIIDQKIYGVSKLIFAN